MGTQGFVLAALLQEVDAGEIAAWNKVKGSKKAGDVATFLKFYPDGYYAGRATALLADLRNSALVNPTSPAAVVAPAVTQQTSRTLPSTEVVPSVKSQGLPPMSLTKPAPPGPDVGSTAALPSPKVSPALGVDTLSGRWRGNSGLCGMNAEITIEAKFFHGWVTFKYSDASSNFSGEIKDDETIDLKVSGGSGYADITGKFPNLRINKAFDTAGAWTDKNCNGAFFSFTRVTPASPVSSLAPPSHDQSASFSGHWAADVTGLCKFHAELTVEGRHIDGKITWNNHHFDYQISTDFVDAKKVHLWVAGKVESNNGNAPDLYLDGDFPHLVMRPKGYGIGCEEVVRLDFTQLAQSK
jgi:hypothetical protein